MSTIEKPKSQASFAIYPTTSDNDDNTYSPAIMVNNVCFVLGSFRNKNEQTMELLSQKNYDQLITMITRELKQAGYYEK